MKNGFDVFYIKFNIKFENGELTDRHSRYYAVDFKKQYNELQSWCFKNIKEKFWLFGAPAFKNYDYECWIPPAHSLYFKMFFCDVIISDVDIKNDYG